MNPFWGHVVGVLTLVTMLVFLAIWVWAWRPKHRTSFDDMSRIPMMDGQESTAADDHEDWR